MTVISYITIVDGNLMVKGKTILSQVPENIVVSASTSTPAQGVFLGASSSERKSRHVFSLGVLRDLRFMCCFRFSLWWMTQRMGRFGKDVPFETQFLLIESKDRLLPLRTGTELKSADATVYTIFLPLLDGPFRASLQGNEDDELQLCMESGDESVTSMGGGHAIYVHTGTDPFQVIADAVQAVEMHMQTFRRREEKKMPGMLDCFGWCTWNAFYTDVDPEGVKIGLKRLNEGGTPARFIIIDDGWQSIDTDDKGLLDGETTAETQYARRLTDVKENHKFRGDGDVPSFDLKCMVKEIKEELSVKYVYVWHALAGYWGGVWPDGEKTEKYESTIKYPAHSPGVLSNQPDMTSDCLTVNGVGLVPTKKLSQFYNELHSYLAGAGVDGVKVDVQNILETLGAGVGGRVSLTRHYHQALEASIACNFPDNGCIACMSHNTDGLYSIKQTAVVRASDDFWPRDPASHTTHIVSVAYNSIFLGEFMQPDWDMFQSLHPAAEYHAAARAIGGCPVYVSDKPGQHDFDLLKKLVLPDGSILRAHLPGRPTRDCLFNDPARDGKSLLKIWNLNKYTGVLGAFNCQGAGWSNKERRNLIHDANPATINASVCARDIEWLARIVPEEWDGDCVLFSYRGGELIYLPRNSALPVTLKVTEYEIFTVSPIKKLGLGVAFAPIGLLKMFNSGGAIISLSYEPCEHNLINEFEERPSSILDFTPHEAERGGTVPTVATIDMEIHGCGECGVYVSRRPRGCRVDSVEASFAYHTESGFLTFVLPEVSKGTTTHDVVIEV